MQSYEAAMKWMASPLSFSDAHLKFKGEAMCFKLPLIPGLARL